MHMGMFKENFRNYFADFPLQDLIRKKTFIGIHRILLVLFVMSEINIETVEVGNKKVGNREI